MSLLSRSSAVALAAALLATSPGMSALAQDGAPAPVAEPADLSSATVLATVNGKELTLGHLLSVVADLPPQYQQLPDDVLYEGVLEQMVQQMVLSDGLGEPSALEQLALENQDRAVRAGLAIQRLLDQDVTDAELQAAYDEIFSSAEPEQEFNAAHILVATEEEAKAIVAELEDGADFAGIAKEKSLDPGSGANGGELGWFGEGMMVPEFEAAVKELEPGKTSGPVQSQFGWHIVLLKDRRQVEQPTLEQLREQLAEQVRNGKVEAAIAEASASATIDRSGAGTVPATVVRRADLLGK